MGWLGMALNLPLMTSYRTKYSVPDCESRKIFTGIEHES